MCPLTSTSGHSELPTGVPVPQATHNGGKDANELQLPQEERQLPQREHFSESMDWEPLTAAAPRPDASTPASRGVGQKPKNWLSVQRQRKRVNGPNTAGRVFRCLALIAFLCTRHGFDIQRPSAHPSSPSSPIFCIALCPKLGNGLRIEDSTCLYQTCKAAALTSHTPTASGISSMIVGTSAGLPLLTGLKRTQPHVEKQAGMGLASSAGQNLGLGTVTSTGPAAGLGRGLGLIRQQGVLPPMWSMFSLVD